MMDPSWADASFAGYDSVYHVAGIAHVPTDTSRSELYMSVNRDLAIRTAEKARADGAGQFIFMSSVIVYGEDGPVGIPNVIRSDTQPAPIDVYGQSKWEAEQGLRALETEPFRVAVIRSPVVYGPGSRGNFPRLLKLADRCPVFPSVGSARSMIYIDNLCAFVRILSDTGASGLFHPQNEEPVDPAEVVRTWRRLQGKRTWLVRGFTPLFRVLSRRIGLVRKVFGNKTIDPALSAAPEGRPYRLVGFEESLKNCRNGRRLSDG